MTEKSLMVPEDILELLDQVGAYTDYSSVGRQIGIDHAIVRVLASGDRARARPDIVEKLIAARPYLMAIIERGKEGK